ncbi:MAG: ComEC/Rec2 family competence protein [Anaerolineae bacterium]|nr:ComEC/Rec2 family competence protein [Anaerolineae bacterium]
MALVYLIAAWGLGIWLGRAAWSAGLMECTSPGPLAWAGLLAAPAAGLAAAQRRPGWRLPMALLLAALLGALRYQLHPFEPCFTPLDLAFYRGTEDAPVRATVVGAVIRPPEERNGQVAVRLRAERLTLEGETTSRPVRGDALFRADRSQLLRVGDRLAVEGWLAAPPNLVDFNYREYLARRGIHTQLEQATVQRLGSVRPAEQPSLLFWRAVYGLRSQGQEIIGRLLPEPEAALLTGILLGVETGIDRDLYDQFNRTGTSHIIVISGFNIAIVAGLLTALLGRLLGKRRAFYPVVAGILFYTVLVGADAAVTRAAIMGILMALAAYLGRQGLALVSLFLAGFAMTALNPLTLWDVGFQLSFTATLSLVLFATPLTRWAERRLGGSVPEATDTGTAAVRQRLLGLLNDALFVTLAAQVLTLPLIAYHFGRVSLVSPLANLLILPVQPYVLIWGGVTMLLALPAAWWPPLGVVLEPLAQGVAFIPWLALHWTVLVVQTLAALPFAAVELRVGALGLWGFYGALALAAWGPRLRSRVGWLATATARGQAALRSAPILALAGGGVLVLSGLLFFALRSLPDGRLHVHFLDVGRGEAILIVTPDGQQVLVDGGYSPSALLGALGEHLPFYDREIELVVLTHPGDERLGGLTELPTRYRVGQVLQPPFPYPSAAYGQWLRRLQAERVPTAAAERGTRVLLGYGIALDVLHPGPEPAVTRSGEPDLAANSTVLRLSYGDTSFLLTGDASTAVQEELVTLGLVGPATVVKVPAGGRQARFSPTLLEASRPQHAVVFTPREDRFRTLDAPVEDAWTAVTGPERFHRTDLAGTVSCASDGRSVVCRHER